MKTQKRLKTISAVVSQLHSFSWHHLHNITLQRQELPFLISSWCRNLQDFLCPATVYSRMDEMIKSAFISTQCQTPIAILKRSTATQNVGFGENTEPTPSKNIKWNFSSLFPVKWSERWLRDLVVTPCLSANMCLHACRTTRRWVWLG